MLAKYCVRILSFSVFRPHSFLLLLLDLAAEIATATGRQPVPGKGQCDAITKPSCSTCAKYHDNRNGRGNNRDSHCVYIPKQAGVSAEACTPRNWAWNRSWAYADCTAATTPAARAKWLARNGSSSDVVFSGTPCRGNDCESVAKCPETHTLAECEDASDESDGACVASGELPTRDGGPFLDSVGHAAPMPHPRPMGAHVRRSGSHRSRRGRRSPQLERPATRYTDGAGSLCTARGKSSSQRVATQALATCRPYARRPIVTRFASPRSGRPPNPQYTNGTASASCPAGSRVLSCNCYSPWSCCASTGAVQPDFEADACVASSVGCAHNPETYGVIVYAVCASPPGTVCPLPRSLFLFIVLFLAAS